MTITAPPVRRSIREEGLKSFRRAFSPQGQALIVVLVGPGKTSGLTEVIKALESLKGRGLEQHLAVFGDSSACLGGGEETSSLRPRISFLEPWARPVLEDVLRVSSILIPLQVPEGWEELDQGALEDLPILLPESLSTSFPMRGLTPIFWHPNEEGCLLGHLGRLLGIDENEAPSCDQKASERTRREPSPPAEAPSMVSPTCDPGVSPGMPGKQSREAGVNTATGFILQNDWGIGDELLLSAVAREIVRTYPNLSIWIRSRFGFRFPVYVRRDAPPLGVRAIETIYQNPPLYGPDFYSPFPGHLVQQMLDKFALDTGLPVAAKDIRPELDLGESVKKDRAPRSVILHTGTNPRLPSKDWGITRWQDLGRILQGEGLEVHQVGGKDERLLPGVIDHRGMPVGELASLFLESQVVISVVGFLMHLAEATGTPAVVIYGGREHPAIDGYPDQIHLSSDSLPCRGRWGCHLAPDHNCPHSMKCMEKIDPGLAAQETISLLSQRAGN